LLKKLTSYQLAEWEAYSVIHPIGEERSDHRISYLAWIITNLFIQAYGKKGSKLTEFKDYIFDWDATAPKEEKVQSVEEMKSVLMMLAKSQETKKGAKRVREIPKNKKI